MTATSPIDLTMASPQHSPLFESPSSSSSASSVSSSPAINPLSLLGDASHTPQTLKLVNISLSQHLIDYIVDQVIDTVDHAMNRPSTLLPASSSSKPSLAPSSRPRTPVQQKFSSFATTVITRAEIITPTLLLALVYIHRARPYLHIALEEWALERVFLGSLIVASKYANDSTLKNVHWALCTGVFGKRDVGRIEREFLAVLEWDLGVTENDILSLWEGLEWAVELKEHEERQKELARLEQEKQKLQLQLAQRQREQQQQSTNSTSKFFLYSGDKSRQSSEDSLDIPPPLPVKSRNHKRSSNVTPSTAAAAAAQLPARQVRQHSPSSSSVSSRSSSSSSSDSPSPATPEDLHSRYIVINESASSPSSSNGDVPPPLPPKKRGLTATTMELLRSFPFPGQQKEYHHHPYRNTSPQQVKHSRYATTDTCAATVRSTVTSSKRYRVLV